MRIKIWIWQLQTDSRVVLDNNRTQTFSDYSLIKKKWYATKSVMIELRINGSPGHPEAIYYRHACHPFEEDLYAYAWKIGVFRFMNLSGSIRERPFDFYEGGGGQEDFS